MSTETNVDQTKSIVGLCSFQWIVELCSLQSKKIYRLLMLLFANPAFLFDLSSLSPPFSFFCLLYVDQRKSIVELCSLESKKIYHLLMLLFANIHFYNISVQIFTNNISVQIFPKQWWKILHLWHIGLSIKQNVSSSSALFNPIKSILELCFSLWLCS